MLHRPKVFLHGVVSAAPAAHLFFCYLAVSMLAVVAVSVCVSALCVWSGVCACVFTSSVYPGDFGNGYRGDARHVLFQ